MIRVILFSSVILITSAFGSSASQMLADKVPKWWPIYVHVFYDEEVMDMECAQEVENIKPVIEKVLKKSKIAIGEEDSPIKLLYRFNTALTPDGEGCALAYQMLVYSFPEETKSFGLASLVIWESAVWVLVRKSRDEMKKMIISEAEALAEEFAVDYIKIKKN